MAGPAVHRVTGRGTRAAREASCQGRGPGHGVGRAHRPLALGSWTCPGPVGRVRLDQADRLAFGSQLWGVIGDSGSVSALRLRQILARGGVLRSHRPLLAPGGGSSAAPHPAPCPGCSVSVDPDLGVWKLPSAALYFTWPVITIVSFQR